MSQITLELPASVSEAEARFFLAMKLFELGRVSCAQAADLAGISKRDFIASAGKQGVAVFNYSIEDLASDLDNA